MTDPSNWRPSGSLDVLRRRAAMLTRARAFFATRGVLEVETPALGTRGVTDPHLANLSCRAAALPGTELLLQTSPEYFMKRLLAAGSPDIYQICRVFRDGELGARHQPEFTMVEWYRREFDLTAMMAETCELLMAMGDSEEAVTSQRYADVFAAATDLDPLTATAAALTARARALLPSVVTDALATQLGHDRGSWLDLLMSHVVIPSFGEDGLLVVHHFPAEQAALARLDPADGRVAERFEVFRRGMELANGYRELTDGAEQRNRFAVDRRRRRELGLPDRDPDQRLLAALDHGLPECSGVAVGFDRVVMSYCDLPDITEALSFAR